MIELFLLAESLTVVPGDDNERLPQDPLRPQGVEDPSQLMVHERDLAVVAVARELLPVRGRRVMGHVGVVEVHPGKEAAAGVGVQPVDERVRDLVAPSLGPERLEHLVVVYAVVVNVESLVQSEARIDVERSDEGRRPESFVPESFREGHGRGGEEIGPVVTDLVG